MDREIKEIVTPNGTKVEIKAYITGREDRELQKTFMSQIQDFNNPENSKITSDMILERQNKAWELVVVSINGIKEKIVDMILDLPLDDTNFIKNAVDEVTGFGKKKPTT